MSKIGEKHIPIEAGITVEVKGKTAHVKGPKGELEIVFPPVLTLSNEDGVIKVTRARDDKKSKSLHGLFRSLLANAMLGVSKPWEKKLEIVGTGFNTKMQGQDLSLKLGFSHQVVFPATQGVTYAVQDNNIITVSGVDKQLVGQVAHLIKDLKKPDVYKGKGIKYQGEKLRIKPGKKAKAVGAA